MITIESTYCTTEMGSYRRNECVLRKKIAFYIWARTLWYEHVHEKHKLRGFSVLELSTPSIILDARYRIQCAPPIHKLTNFKGDLSIVTRSNERMGVLAEL